MDHALLVSVEYTRGEEMLKALDSQGLEVSVAVWAYLSEFEEWRLILASPEFDEAGNREGYALFRETLDKAGFPIQRIPRTMIFAMKHPMIRDLRRRYKNDKYIDGARIGGQTIGDRFIEDAYAYRIS